MEDSIKVGIITLHRTSNYGGVLQPFALQSVLEGNGFEVEIIDYYPEANTVLGQLKRLKSKSDKMKNPILYVGALGAFTISYIKKKIVFEKYIYKNLNLSKQIYKNLSDLERNIPLADIYCAGGDQVWHGFDKARFFPFVHNKPIVSYSASFGKDSIDSEIFDKICTELRRFSKVSTREKSGLSLLRSLGREDGIWTLDSTLLWNKKKWMPYISDTYKGKDYILTYNLHHDGTIDNFAKELSLKCGLPVYNICMHWFEVYRFGKRIWCPKVEDYLSLFYNANYVIGDSFHGTVFSILFHKKFVSVIPDKVGTRIGSILELTKLEQRAFIKNNRPDLDIIEQEIDYDNVDCILERERQKALDYIGSWKDLVKSNIIYE